MAISTNYPSPVMVNGFSCRNCTEVDLAKRNIDPARPKAGPFGLNDPRQDQVAPNLPKRMDQLAADRRNLSSYSANGAMAASNATGTLVDRLG